MVTVRQAKPEELDDVGELLVAAYSQYFPASYATESEREAWEGYREELRDVSSRLAESTQLVAVEDERILGAVSSFAPGVYGQHGVAPEAGWSGIRLLGVVPDARGRGIGRLLTEACVERARTEGAVGVTLHTTHLMEVARAMYERMGFERAPALDFHPIEGSDFVVMAYRLRLE